VLNGIPSNAPNHNIAATYSRADRSPWDDSSITNCITTNGGEGCSHPSGQRGLTHRELAALQGFPHNHVFCGQEIRKQIGNAVPPIIARIIFESVRNHLEKVDVVQKQRSFNR
jgi:DNA (cytosine-5)-methyltransferase 1